MIQLRQIEFKEAMKMVEEGRCDELYMTEIEGIVPTKHREVVLSLLPKRTFFKIEKVDSDE